MSFAASKLIYFTCVSISDNISTEWLSNSSFLTQIPKRESLDVSSSDESSFNAEKQVTSEIIPRDTKIHARQRIDKEQKADKKRRTRDSKRYKPKYELDVENVYFEDRRRDKGNNNINTFCPRARPYYNVNKKSLGDVKRKQSKKNSFHRYYVKNIDSAEAAKKKDTVIKKTNEKEASIEDNEANESIPSWCKNLEEEQKLKTREYNEQLTENPHNVELWLQYINFQVFNISFCILIINNIIMFKCMLYKIKLIIFQYKYYRIFWLLIRDIN